VEQKFNLDLFWKKIFVYTNYRSLSVPKKKLVDKIFADLSELVTKAQGRQAVDLDTNVYSLKKYDLKKLKNEDRFWLIDNPLNIIFTGVYACHEIMRPVLTILHFLIENRLNNDIISFLIEGGNYHIIDVNKSELSEIYTAMHYGLYESGAEVEANVSVENVIVSNGYPFEELEQSIIKQKYKIDSIDYTKEEAIDDFNSINFK